MLTELPRDTDFYGVTSRPYQGAEEPGTDPLRYIFPRPRRLEILPAASPRAERSVEQLAPEGSEAERALAAAGVRVPAHPEGYAVAPVGGCEVVAARSPLGLLRARSALLQLSSWRGRLVVEDYPATDLRILGGWALCRTDGLGVALDLASSMRANRVLLNGWGWVPGDHVTREEELFAARAREELGVELIFELRRMSFGRDASVAHPENRRRIVAAYEEAAARGFRSFGLLFDDVPWETAEDECTLAREVLDALGRKLSGAPGSPELIVCPQIYWSPGQMDATWKGRAGTDETETQRRYLATYGRLLPPGIHLYVANAWGGHLSGVPCGRHEPFAELVGRRPIFFDNQLINDYRLGAIYPFGLADRPPSLGEDYAGYVLNAGRPLTAHAPSAATALAFAWNPAGHTAAGALARALAWQHGAGRRATRAGAATRRLASLANAWSGGTTTAVSHLATLWKQVQEGRVDRRELSGWREELRALRGDWLGAIGEPAPDAHPSSLEALFALVRDTYRLEVDLEVFEAFLESRTRGDREGRGLERALERAGRTAADTLHAILPRAPGIDLLLRSPESLAPAEAPAWSWVEYFVRNTRRTLGELSSEARAFLQAAANKTS